MSQINPNGGFFAVDAGVSIPPSDGPYGRAPETKGDVAEVQHSDPSANVGYDAAGSHVYATPVDVSASAPEIVGPQGDAAQVQTDNDPSNVSGPAPEVGLSDVYGAVQALDAKIDDLFSQSPWVQPKPDTDD